jgi:alpha-glucosidase
VLPIVRDWIRLRYRLLPYMYTLYWRAAQFGEPMLRPLFYEFPDDPRAFDDSDDFMLGPGLLVASIVEPDQRERSVYLPKGPPGWFDFWTGKRYRAGATVVAPAPLQYIPLFVPAGAMIPTTDTADMSRRHDETSRALRIFPARGAAASSFTLYEDDGFSLRYLDGESAQVAFDLESTTRTLVLHARKSGSFGLPENGIRVILPPGERRPLRYIGDFGAK